MATERPPGLLGPDDPVPFICLNAEGMSPFLLTGDHAGRAIPRRLGTLALDEHDLGRHIALDIGVGDLGGLLSERLDATFLSQAYSRLVVDCNRDPQSRDAIPLLSDGTAVAANTGLTAPQRRARIVEIHEPYHASIAAVIAARLERRQETILIALHSFTPTMNGICRPWDVGVLHNGGNSSFARRLLDVLRRDAGLNVGDNQPYRMDNTDHSVPRHAFPNGLAYAEIEVRQDLIADAAGQKRWADVLGSALLQARTAPH